MYNRILGAVAGVLLAVNMVVFPTYGQETTEEQQAGLTEQQQYDEWAKEFLADLNMVTGTVTLDGLATLELGDNYYYLDAKDTKKVLEDAWGNPPDDGGLGMLFPLRYSPLDGPSWGVTIHYEPTGYVNDEDASSINYEELLEEMKKDTADASEYRLEQGYDSMELIGWASKPYYDVDTKKLHWAKELKFGSSDRNTLNYNVRILGRKGVLVMNFIAGMDQLSEIQNEIDTVLAMTNFRTGNTYADFDPSIDEVAAVGVAGLIAGKVITKTGFLLTALLFLKKFWFLIAAAFVGAWKMISRRGDKAEQGAASGD